MEFINLNNLIEVIEAKEIGYAYMLNQSCDVKQNSPTLHMTHFIVATRIYVEQMHICHT